MIEDSEYENLFREELLESWNFIRIVLESWKSKEKRSNKSVFGIITDSKARKYMTQSASGLTTFL